MNLPRIYRYYDRTESRLGYRYLLGGTKHFGWYDPADAKWKLSAAMRRMEDQLAARLSLEPGSKVLDAGCGMGDVARYQARVHGLTVSGIDILDFNVAEANARSRRLGLDGKTSFQVGDYHELPFTESTFDGAYTMETFVHSANPAKALSEFYRVLKPGGRMVMFEYSRAPDEFASAKARQALADVCEIAAMPAWLELYDGELEKLLTQAGFKVESKQDVTDKILPMLQVFSILGKVPYAIARLLNKREKAINAMSGVELYRHREAWRYRIYTATKPRV